MRRGKLSSADPEIKRGLGNRNTSAAKLRQADESVGHWVFSLSDLKKCLISALFRAWKRAAFAAWVGLKTFKKGQIGGTEKAAEGGLRVLLFECHPGLNTGLKLIEPEAEATGHIKNTKVFGGNGESEEIGPRCRYCGALPQRHEGLWCNSWI
jgi:hypothetical protein